MGSAYSKAGGYCYGCMAENNLTTAVVDGKDVLICSSCDPDSPDETDTAGR